jgi:predicted AlkP superfamily phosphohydrolase/phosphomutase
LNDRKGGRLPRVAAIGLDSADWKVLEWLLERGALPNIAALAQRGVAVPLRNERLYRTSLVWEAFLTGDADPPSRFSGAMAFDPQGYASQKVGARPVTTFFDRLGGVRTLAFDVPYLSLAGGGDGPRVSCWGGHIRAYPRAASPRGLLREIDARFGTHPAWAIEHRFLWHRPDKLAEVAKALAEGARRRAAIVEWLADRYPDWDLLLTVLSESHSAAEWFGHGLAERPPLTAIPTAGAAREHLKHVYQALDEAVGHIVAALPDDVTVAVFSVHGSGANNVDVASTVLLPELLHRLQLGRPLLRDPDQREWRRAEFPPIVPRRREDWHSYMSGRRIGSAAARLSRWGRYIPRRTAGQVAEETAQSPDEIGTPRKAIDYQVVSWYRAAWPQMRAFALPTFSDGRVRVNLEGREAAGKVAAADYEQVCDEVERSVRACRDPRTGRSIVEGVKRPRASDPMDPDGPDADLVIEWVDGIDALEHPDAGMVGPFPFHRMAGHTPDGFAFLAGPGTQPTRLGERDAAELPPTLVSLLRGESATDTIPLLATELTAG